MAIQYLFVSWKEYHDYARNLASALLSKQHKYDEIVAISRGGLTLGHVLTDLLRIPISIITIQSYTDIQTQGEVKIIGKPQTPMKGKKLLLVDDVADSGKTIERALSYLQTYNPKHITTVTMFYKPRSIVKPDYYAQTTTQWILFPYEPIEMISSIAKNLKTEGKTKDETIQILTSIGYTHEYIDFAYKHHVK